jgi:soluble lytic murein transglycosylase-like protein
MPQYRKLLLSLTAVVALAACGVSPHASSKNMQPDALPLNSGESAHVRNLINKYADSYQVPRTLVHRVVQRESGYNPQARNGRYMGLVQRIIVRESTHRPGARNGPYYGLMQILPATARGMGYQGSPQGLLDAETNLKYAVKYLRGAWLVADGSEDAAVGWYARGYYYEAKRRGVLNQAGL